jgi:hypothetical protein
MKTATSLNRCRGGQRGQILIFCLAMLIAGAGALMLMFDTTQVLTAKSRVVQAADASAYSAAAWRARVFNYIAYSNRAIIAQEVAVAQAVTLHSWSRYFGRFTRNINSIATAYPPAAAITSAIADAAQLASATTAVTASQEIRLRDGPGTGYKTLLQHSQRVLRTAAGTFGASAVANEVAKATDPRIFAFALPDDDAYTGMTRRYESDDDRRRLKDLVLASMDEFTAGPRRENQTLILPASCLLLSPSPSDWFQRYRKRGGTVLANNGLERWEAADTGSIHDSRRSRWSRLCRRKETLPMGWGAAEALPEPGIRRLTENPGDVNFNATASAFNETEFRQSEAASYQGTGIAKVYDLDYGKLADTRFPSSRVAVLASMSASRIRTGLHSGLSSGRLGLVMPSLAKKLWSIAAAEVYFRRAPGAPERTEFASLFSPYWQARLVSPNAREREEVTNYGVN